MKSTKDTTEDSKLNKEKVESDRNKVKTRRTLIQLLYVYAILDYLNDIILCFFFFFTQTFRILTLQELKKPLFCFIITSFLLRGNFFLLQDRFLVFLKYICRKPYGAIRNNLLKNSCPPFLSDNAHLSQQSPS